MQTTSIPRQCLLACLSLLRRQQRCSWKEQRSPRSRHGPLSDCRSLVSSLFTVFSNGCAKESCLSFTTGMPGPCSIVGQNAGLQDLNLGGNVLVLGGLSCKEFFRMVATAASSPSLGLCAEADAARPTLLWPSCQTNQRNNSTISTRKHLDSLGVRGVSGCKSGCQRM